MPIYPERKFEPIQRRTELDVLKSAHKFLRDDSEPSKELDWDNTVARKFYSSLFREFAVCNLKHYKAGQVALRWRTEDEVLSGAGETSCGNIRCSHHEAPSSGPASTSNRRWDEDDDDRGKKHRSKEKPKRKLVTVELPFAYSEDGEAKSALVKVVLCDKCFKKLNWKREKDKELARAAAEPSIESAMRAERSTTATARDDYRITPRDRDVGESRSLEGRDDQQVPRTRRSRSRSPPKPYDIRDQWMR